MDGQQQPVLRAYRGPPCRIEGCEGVARYGRKGEDAPVCCSQHRTPEMADLTNAICQEPTCVKRAIYGISARRQWCSLHKPAGAVNLNRPKRPGTVLDAVTFFGEVVVVVEGRRPLLLLFL